MTVSLRVFGGGIVGIARVPLCSGLNYIGVGIQKLLWLGVKVEPLRVGRVRLNDLSLERMGVRNVRVVVERGVLVQ